jgi:hypothetical protein
MDRLETRIDALRALAKQPGSEVNRIPLAELQINEYVQAEVTALRSRLERMREAIGAEGESLFWTTVREYLQSRLSHLIDDYPSLMGRKKSPGLGGPGLKDGRRVLGMRESPSAPQTSN